jgi:hypothetical protein
MDKLNATKHSVTPVSPRKPRAYHPPALTAYGSVAKLTQSGSGSAVDGVNTMMRAVNPPGQL